MQYVQLRYTCVFNATIYYIRGRTLCSTWFLEYQLVTDVIDGVVAMETVHETPINEFLSQSGIYQ